uniref:Cyclin-like domain-containing protein n=1 Tax=Oncorhynchus mykiss TaxID=8022 RepID=A0A8C7LSN5_ONCMY
MLAFLCLKLKSNISQESYFLPRETGLNIMESAAENHNGVSAKCRNAKVEDLWSLTSFFGFSTQTFVLAVNLLDRFLAIMKVQPKHLPCIGVSCLHIAAKMVEDECNISPTHELIRISQSKFTVSDLSRMEKIISGKLNLELKAVTALTFLHLYHAVIVSLTSESEYFSNCCFLFLSQIVDSELLYWRGLVAKCMTEYRSSECNKPDNKKLLWIVSRRTAQNLHANNFSVPELPTIPEGSWGESESEDSCEDMSCEEDSPCSSPGSDEKGAFFPVEFRNQGRK